ncbi:MAG: phosphoribosylformylglycinamidine synthase II, partial [Candidatus Thermoplasmatota archaeon]|nr:phosphoribosylformylglycinamidine synthase II [Candidatus Thermoplasmatota archaeon]
MTVEHLYKKVDVPFPLHHVLVRSASDEELMELSRDGGVALSLEEMRSMKEYFQGLERDPTDVEFQALGQAWSEHCCYKSSRPVLKKYIAGIDAPQNILPITEDAGIVEFDDEYAY